VLRDVTALSISVSVTSWSRMLDETGRLDQVNNDLSMDVLGLRLTIDMWRWFEECLGVSLPVSWVAVSHAEVGTWSRID